MRALLDFLYDHSFDKALYCVLPSPDGELQLTWRASHPASWEIRHAGTELVPRDDLLERLAQLGADLAAFERELGTMVAAHVVVADHVLQAAHDAIGGDGVRNALRGQQEFVRELRAVLRTLQPPHLRLVR